MNRFTPAIAVVALLGTSGCASDGKSNKGIGAVIGGLAGGLGCAALGGNTGTCLAVAGAGALAGGIVGNKIDRRDRARRDAALKAAMADDRWRRPGSSGAVQWVNPETGNSGSITPVATTTDHGRECRVIEERYIKNSEPIREKRTVCRGANGSFV